MQSNVYLEARREWDERYADLVLGKRNWQIATACSMTVSLVLAIGMVWQSNRSRYVPYVVEVDKLGYALTVPKPLAVGTEPALVDRMVRYEIASFIRSARSVSTDTIAEQHSLDDLLAHVRGTADKFLDAYYHDDDFVHDPFKLAQHETVSVQIDSILQLSPKSYEVRWTEVRRDLNGAALGVPTHWEAELQTQIVPPREADAIVTNPLGFYVDRISWTQQRG
jgi:type IV secretory pathway TrbF-like protein